VSGYASVTITSPPSDAFLLILLAIIGILIVMGLIFFLKRRSGGKSDEDPEAEGSGADSGPAKEKVIVPKKLKGT
jgi:hypothetical protein